MKIIRHIFLGMLLLLTLAPGPASSADACEEIDTLTAMAPNQGGALGEAAAFEAVANAAMACAFEAGANTTQETIAYRRAGDAFLRTAKIYDELDTYKANVFKGAYLAYYAYVNAQISNRKTQAFDADDLNRVAQNAHDLALRYKSSI